MKKLKSHFRFNKQERSGIFFLLLTIVLLQLGYFLWKTFSANEKPEILQADVEMQAEFDRLKEEVLKQDSIKIFPFNPNFISDYKGYTLGMSAEEIDRLHKFRKRDKFINTPEEFQQVTQVSDSLLQSIAPYLKFPDWVEKKSPKFAAGAKLKTKERNDTSLGNVPVKDINTATANDFKQINGIGEKLSARIIKFRNRLGGFLIDEQLYDVYGMKPEVVERALAQYKVIKKPAVKKIDINKASSDELAGLVYLRHHVAKEIVAYREASGTIESLKELSTIDGFPTDKIDRLALYLSL